MSSPIDVDVDIDIDGDDGRTIETREILEVSGERQDQIEEKLPAGPLSPLR